MARKPFKTFSAKDAEKLKGLVSSFNRKITEVSKTPTLAGAQPARIKYSELTKNIRTRAEYNRIYNVYSRYLKRGAERIYTNESGVRLTRWIRDESTIATRRVNNARAKTLKRFESLPQPLRVEARNDLNLEPRRNSIKTIIDKNYSDKYFKGLQRQASADYFAHGEELYKKNYLKALRRQLAGMPGFRKLYDTVKALDGGTLLEAQAQDPTFEVNFIYGFEEATLRIEYLQEQWEDYLDDN